MKHLPSLLITVILFFVVGSCSKPDEDKDLSNNNCLIESIHTIEDPALVEIFFYDDQKRLVKYIFPWKGAPPDSSIVDTFFYDNGLLARTQWNLGNDIKPVPYAYSIFHNQNGKIVSSDAYFSQTWQYATCTYTWDTAGRISTFTQKNPNGSSESTMRFVYDSHSNLSKIYASSPGVPEYLFEEYLEYDDKPNPLYALPWIWDVDFYLWNVSRLSKNNWGRIKRYQQNGSVVGADRVYTYEYDGYGKVTKRLYTFGNNSITSLYTYKCL
jgi:hypothetical protein